MGAYYHHLQYLKELKNPSEAPFQNHFLIIYFSEDSIATPGYDEGDPVEYKKIETRKIYWTLDKQTWQNAIKRFYEENQHRKDILCYEVVRQARVQVKIDVE